MWRFKSGTGPLQVSMGSFYCYQSDKFAQNHRILILKKAKWSEKQHPNECVVFLFKKLKPKSQQTIKRLLEEFISSHIRYLSDYLQISVDMAKVRNGHFLDDLHSGAVSTLRL